MKLNEMLAMAMAKLGKSEVPEMIVKSINTTKKKAFIKRAKKDLLSFYKDDSFQLVLSAIEEDVKVITEIEKIPVRPTYSRTAVNQAVDLGKSLDSLHFFDLLREVKSQEEAYKHFPEVFVTAEEMVKYNQFVTSISQLKPRVEAAYTKKGAQAFYNNKIAELQDFLKSYNEVISLLK